MDFDKLLAKAGSNLKKHSEKVREADLEMEIDRQRKLQRLAIQKRTEREEIKRKAPPKPEPPKQRSFIIPKKAQKAEPEVDKEKLAKFLNRQEQEKRQKEIKKQKEKDELIRLRLESMGGKANKKLSKQFGKSPIELQIRYGNNSEHADILMKQQQREEEEQERLAALYRQGVSKAVQHKNKIVAKLSSNSSNKKENSTKMSSSSNHRPEPSSRPTTAPNKRPPVPASAIKSSASTNNSSAISSANSFNGGSAERKRKMPEMEDFQLLMKKAQHNRELIEEGGFPEDIPPQPKLIRKSLEDERPISKKERQYPGMQEKVSRDRPLPKQQDSFKKPFDPVHSKSFASKPNHSSTGPPSSSSKSFKTPQLPQPSSSKLSRPQQSVIKSNVKGDRSNTVLGNSKEQLEPSERPKKVIVVDPETGVVKDKKYLPGDIRYKGGPCAPPPPSVQKRIPPIKSMKEASPKPRRDENGFTKAVNASKSISNSAFGQRRPEMDSARPSSSTSSNPKTSKFKTEEVMRSEIERRRREARLMEKELEQRRVQAEQRKMDISLNKIKKDERMKFEMRQQQQKSRKPMDYSREQHIKKSGDSSRFTNFSETDEDEEDEGPYEESDEYDSEMDDFIDDSIVDDLQREDFEESLKLINPRYDKKKWKMREMMIDDRKMDARYKDIETEEKLSAKIGLYEDIREARRGSKQVG